MDTSNISDTYMKRKMELRNEHIAYDVESWYTLIENLTFKTKFIDITPEEGEAMRSFYAARYTQRKEGFNMGHIQLVKNLVHKINHILTCDNSEFKENGAFVRLSSRSPKDGSPFEMIEFEKKFQSSLSQIIKEDNDYELFLQNQADNFQGIIKDHLTGDMDANRKMRAFCLASSQTWRVRNGHEAMNLILSSILNTKYI